jgi:hypothetical protein
MEYGVSSNDYMDSMFLCPAILILNKIALLPAIAAIAGALVSSRVNEWREAMQPCGHPQSRRNLTVALCVAL